MTAPLGVTLLDEQRYEPGVHDIPEAAYFGARYALSCSGTKLLLPPSCPAKFAYEQEHGGHASRAMTLGTIAHRMTLGAGPELVVPGGGRPKWDTKEIKEEIAAIRADGKMPVKQADLDAATAMAAALRAHPVASVLLDPWSGLPEQSLFWNDARTGQPCRARLDWLPEPYDGWLIIPDYKTAESAEPRTWAKNAADYGYHMQHWWYSAAVEALGLAGDAQIDFTFIVQEKAPPYLVSVIRLDPEAVRIGGNRCKYAIDVYRRCVADDDWPGYSDEIEEVSLPAWSRAGEDPL